MNTKKLLPIWISTLILSFVIENGGFYLLTGDLAADTRLPWATQPNGGWGLVVLISVVFAFAFTYVFLKGYEGKGIGEGVRFGIWVTLLASVTENLGYAAALPIPPALTAKFIGLDAVTFIVCGCVAAMIVGRRTRA